MHYNNTELISQHAKVMLNYKLIMLIIPYVYLGGEFPSQNRQGHLLMIW